METNNTVAKRTLLMAGCLILVILFAVAAKAATLQPTWMP